MTLHEKWRRLSPIWLVPIAAVGVVVYLIATTLAARGAEISITFNTAEGLSANQTEVRYKAVSLGTVQEIHLAEDHTHVEVRLRMDATAKAFLTDRARFWVVRPRLNAGIAGLANGLQTLVSGAYIEVDPGAPGGRPERSFRGLEEPPGVRSDEPGHIYVLKAHRLGSLGVGAPIFFRGFEVGEVLSTTLGDDGLGSVTVRVFVRAPYDKFVAGGTRFWNVSGLTVGSGGDGFHLEIASIQAVFSGGIAFETRSEDANRPAPEADTVFTLHDNKADADAAGFTQAIECVTYVDTGVGGMAEGSPVQLLGIRVGTVTESELVLDSQKGRWLARVEFVLQPERVPAGDQFRSVSDASVAEAVSEKGLRVVVDSTSFVLGQKILSLQYVGASAQKRTNAPKPLAVQREGNAIVIPGQGGGLDGITTALADVANKVSRIPFDEIGNNLNHTLISVDQTVGGPAMQNALISLSQTLGDVRHLVKDADAGLGPLLQRLPAIAEQLQQAVQRANGALGETGYGQNSDFQRSLVKLMNQVNQAVRSIHAVAELLDQHPEALIRGRTAQVSEP